MNRLVDVLQGREVDARPIWIMRQAGRYLPEYRALREKAGSFLGLCYNPEAAIEVTLQPLARFDLDAAILFSDILVVPHAMGLSLDFREGEGPVLQTVFDLEGVRRLRDISSSVEISRVIETVSGVKARLPGDRGFIGFCGAPWTVASYMVEGRSSNRSLAIRLAVERPGWFVQLIDVLVEASISYLCRQIEAGCDVVQIFDSWAGDVPLSSRSKIVLDPIKRIIQGVRARHENVPIIVFARGVGEWHQTIAAGAGASAVGVEQGVDLGTLLNGLPKDVAVQGNLTPECLFLNRAELRSEILRILEAVPRSRHIFNLGHGILPDTDPGQLEYAISVVREFDRLNP